LRLSSRRIFVFLLVVLVTVASAPLQTVGIPRVLATPIVQGFDCWTDSPEYQIGQEVTVYVKIPEVYLVTRYWLAIHKPDGSQVTRELGELLPAEIYQFALGKADRPSGQYRIEFWMNPESPELGAYCHFKVAEEFRIWTDKPLYCTGETVTIHIEPEIRIGVCFWFMIYRPDGSKERTPDRCLDPGQQSAAIIADQAGHYTVELWSQVVAPDTTPELAASCRFEGMPCTTTATTTTTGPTTTTTTPPRPPNVKVIASVTDPRAVTDIFARIEEVLDDPTHRLKQGDRLLVDACDPSRPECRVEWPLKVGDMIEVYGVAGFPDCPWLPCPPQDVDAGIWVGPQPHYLKLIIRQTTVYVYSLAVSFLGQDPASLVGSDLHASISVNYLLNRESRSTTKTTPFSLAADAGSESSFSVSSSLQGWNFLCTWEDYGRQQYTNTCSLTVQVASNSQKITAFFQQITVHRTPPELSVSLPVIDCRTVTIDGTAKPTTPGAAITRIHIDWGDETSEDHPFPASHTYASDGKYLIVVKVYDSNGLSSSVPPISLTIACGGSAPKISYVLPAGNLESGVPWIDVIYGNWFKKKEEPQYWDYVKNAMDNPEKYTRVFGSLDTWVKIKNEDSQPVLVSSIVVRLLARRMTKGTLLDETYNYNWNYVYTHTVKAPAQCIISPGQQQKISLESIPLRYAEISPLFAPETSPNGPIYTQTYYVSFEIRYAFVDQAEKSLTTYYFLVFAIDKISYVFSEILKFVYTLGLELIRAGKITFEVVKKMIELLMDTIEKIMEAIDETGNIALKALIQIVREFLEKIRDCDIMCDAEEISLEETGHKLHLIVYDSSGKRNSDISGAAFFTAGTLTCGILPFSERGYRIVVDGSEASLPSESYELSIVSVRHGRMVSVTSRTDVIAWGSKIEYELNVSEIGNISLQGSKGSTTTTATQIEVTAKETTTKPPEPLPWWTGAAVLVVALVAAAAIGYRQRGLRAAKRASAVPRILAVKSGGPRIVQIEPSRPRIVGVEEEEK